MVEVLSGNKQTVAEVHGALFKGMVAELGGKLAVLYRKISVAQLISYYFIKPFILIGDRSIYIDFRTRNKNGNKEGKAHNMVPVGMGEKELGFQRTLWNIVLYNMFSKLTNSGSSIKNDKTVFIPYSELYTGGIPAELNRLRTWTGN